MSKSFRDKNVLGMKTPLREYVQVGKYLGDENLSEMKSSKDENISGMRTSQRYIVSNNNEFISFTSRKRTLVRPQKYLQVDQSPKCQNKIEDYPRTFLW